MTPEQEGSGLHAALCSATPSDFRLGLSAQQLSPAQAAAALQQAEQALQAARTERSAASFSRLDPLQDLLRTPAAQALQTQLGTQLQAADPEGKLEETLRRYLVHAGPLGGLAEELNIHINTLRYRLGRLEDVLGGRLSEPAFVARLYLALSVPADGR